MWITTVSLRLRITVLECDVACNLVVFDCVRHIKFICDEMQRMVSTKTRAVLVFRHESLLVSVIILADATDR